MVSLTKKIIREVGCTVLGHVGVGQDPNWIAFTPDGKMAVVSNAGSNDVSIIDTTQRKVVSSWSHDRLRQEGITSAS